MVPLGVAQTLDATAGGSDRRYSAVPDQVPLSLRKTSQAM